MGGRGGVITLKSTKLASQLQSRMHTSLVNNLGKSCSNFFRNLSPPATPARGPRMLPAHSTNTVSYSAISSPGRASSSSP